MSFLCDNVNACLRMTSHTNNTVNSRNSDDLIKAEDAKENERDCYAMVKRLEAQLRELCLQEQVAKEKGDKRKSLASTPEKVPEPVTRKSRSESRSEKDGSQVRKPSRSNSRSNKEKVVKSKKSPKKSPEEISLAQAFYNN